MSLFDTFRRYLGEERPVALATVVAGPDNVGAKIVVHPDGSAEGSMAPPELACRVAGDAVRLLKEERSETVTHALPEGEFDVFIDVFPAPARLVIVGAGHIAEALTQLASLLGYQVTVADARAAFALPERFPGAEHVVKGWPQDVLPSIRLDASTYVVLLSHDSKFDDPTLHHVLPTDVPYIGAIGSRKTQAERFARLREGGFSDEQLARIYGPVGLDLGGKSAMETALAIMAEITAVRRGGSGGYMRRESIPS